MSLKSNALPLTPPRPPPPPQTKRVTFPFTSFDQLASHVVHLLLEADHTLRQRKPDTMFDFCPIVGMDLSRYAKIHDANAQLIVNQAVRAINEQITVLDKIPGVSLLGQPQLSSKAAMAKFMNIIVTLAVYPRPDTR